MLPDHQLKTYSPYGCELMLYTYSLNSELLCQVLRQRHLPAYFVSNTKEHRAFTQEGASQNESLKLKMISLLKEFSALRDHANYHPEQYYQPVATAHELVDRVS